MSAGNGDGNGAVKITGAMLLSALGTLFFAWGVWVTHAALLADGHEARMNGIVRLIGDMCGPKTKESP